jgi:hypothetical protein
MGEFKGRAGVFPPLIDKTEFDKVQAMLARNKGIRKETLKDGKVVVSYTSGRRGHRAEMVNIFAGMIFCQCGRRATLTPNGNRHYYRCPYAYQGTGCTQRRTFPSHLLEEDFFAIVLKQTATEVMGDASAENKERLATLKTNRETLTRKINVLLALDDAEMPTEEVKTRFQALKAERAQVEKDIAEIQHTMSLIGHAPKAIGEITKLLASGNDVALDAALRRMQDTLKDKAIRQRLQVLMPSILTRIELDFAKLAFTATFPSGKSVRHSIPV